ncbi:MAG: leucine-rich repeat domain-containing protein [Bacteroidales bacterium]|nr:leucine-rich repeat domain-containing protein [Bacteroidales bacterium]
MKIINCKNEHDIKKCLKQSSSYMANLMEYNVNIKPQLFEGDDTLHLVLGGPQIEIIGERAFANCWNLERFDGLPKVIGPAAFTFCESLKDFNFTTINNLYPDAFSYSGLQQVELPSNIKNIPPRCFQACLRLRNLNLNRVETIEEEAFQSSGIKVLNIPISLETIGKKSFEGCVYLSDIVCERFLPPKLAASTFYGCSIKNIWVFSEAQLEFYLKDRYWSKFDGHFRIGTPKVLKQRMEEIRSQKDILW